MPARNLGDWYDVDAILHLLNTMLADHNRAERFASLHTNDQTAVVVGGPRAAIETAFKDGVLQPGEPGAAEASGKAFEKEVVERLTR